jgi:hypothetical protein
LALIAQMLPAAAIAQTASPDVTELSRQIEALRVEQQQSARRITDLEAALSHARAAAPTAVAAATPAPSFTASSTPSRLQLSGDVRVRYESNFSDKDARNRDRGVLRARLRGTYAVNKWLTVGGQIATSDPDDPNSSDITLSNFDDDLQVSLDQAYLRGTFGNLQIHAGKIPQPFVRTELVWDGDVSPQGVSAAYKMPLGNGASIKVTGLYFLVDESVAWANSDMIGGQIGVETAPSAPVKFELAG